jgi:histidinol phosphatase-like PHP family hydrolase
MTVLAYAINPAQSAPVPKKGRAKKVVAEAVPEPEPVAEVPPPVVKKERSPAQIAAQEKMKLAREAKKALEANAALAHQKAEAAAAKKQEKLAAAREKRKLAKAQAPLAIEPPAKKVKAPKAVALVP